MKNTFKNLSKKKKNKLKSIKNKKNKQEGCGQPSESLTPTAEYSKVLEILSKEPELCSTQNILYSQAKSRLDLPFILIGQPSTSLTPSAEYSMRPREDIFWNKCNKDFTVYHYPIDQKNPVGEKGEYFFCPQCYSHTHPYWSWQNLMIRYDLILTAGCPYAVLREYEDLGNESLVVFLQNITCQLISNEIEVDIYPLESGRVTNKKIKVYRFKIKNDSAKLDRKLLDINQYSFKKFINLITQNWDYLDISQKEKIYNEIANKKLYNYENNWKNVEQQEWTEILNTIFRFSDPYSTPISKEQIELLKIYYMHLKTPYDDEYNSYFLFQKYKDEFVRTILGHEEIKQKIKNLDLWNKQYILFDLILNDDSDIISNEYKNKIKENFITGFKPSSK